jgi:serralysin
VIENAVTGDGDDLILGNVTGNELHGMRGDDTLDGGAGDDALYGGAGADVFVFADGYGIDVIEDFEFGIDTVHLAYAGITFADLSFGSDVGGNATLDMGAGDILVFSGLGGETFVEDDFEFGYLMA